MSLIWYSSGAPTSPYFVATGTFLTENSNTDVSNPWFEFFQSLKCVILKVAHHLKCFHLNCFCNGSWLGNVLLVRVHKDFSLVMSDVWASVSKWRKTFLFIWILDKENKFTVSHDGLKSMAGVEHLSMTWMHRYTLYKYLLLPSTIKHLLDYAWKVSWAMHTLCLAQLCVHLTYITTLIPTKLGRCVKHK